MSLSIQNPSGMKAAIRASLAGAILLSLIACGSAQQGAEAPAAAESTAREVPATAASKPADAASPAPAQPALPPRAAPGEKARAAAPRRAPRREWFESLSDVQRSGVRDLRQRTAASLGELRAVQREQQQTFHAALASGDGSAARAASSRLADLAAQTERTRLEEMIELSSLLTPEQLEQMPQQLRGGLQRGGRFGGGRAGTAGAVEGAETGGD